MRLVIISDSHGNYDGFKKIVLKHINEAEAFLFLGDGMTEYTEIKTEFSHVTFHAVKGNNDIGWNEPLQRIVRYDNINILMLHGHTTPMFYFNEKVAELAKENNAQIVLSGHTHVPKTDYLDGVHILNPGSIKYPRNGSKRSYGVIDITDTSIFKMIMEVPTQ